MAEKRELPDMNEFSEWKPLVAAATLGVIWTAEGLLPMFEGRRRRIGHDLTNVGLGVFNAVVTAAGFAGASLWVTECARASGAGLFHWLAWPAGIEWPLALLLFDGWQYLWHKINHLVPFLWRFHAVHHSDEELDASTALRFHTGEIVFSSIVRLAVLPVLGMTLGQLLLYEIILLPVILFHHSNIGVPQRVDRYLRWLIVTPWMHWVHHSRLLPETNSNYASVFSFWDRMFRTYRYRDNPRDIPLGLEGYSLKEWRSIIGFLTTPFYKKCGSDVPDTDGRSGGPSHGCRTPPSTPTARPTERPTAFPD